MAMLDKMRGLNMLVSIPDFLINAVRVQVPEVTSTSVYNVAAETWLEHREHWTLWIDEVIARSFDSEPDLWGAIEDLLIDIGDELERHFRSLNIDWDCKTYVVEPAGDGDNAVLWKIEE